MGGFKYALYPNTRALFEDTAVILVLYLFFQGTWDLGKVGFSNKTTCTAQSFGVRRTRGATLQLPGAPSTAPQSQNDRSLPI